MERHHNHNGALSKCMMKIANLGGFNDTANIKYPLDVFKLFANAVLALTANNTNRYAV